LAFAPWGTRSSAGQVKARAASSGRPHAHPLRLPVASSRASRGTVPRWLVAPASATEGGKDVETERPEAGEAAEDKDEDPRFYWDAANLRWVRDKRGQPLSAWKEGGYTQIKPKTGEAYTVWPAVHIALTNRGLKSIPVEEALKMCQENKAIIVDVRPEYQYKKSHADPSVNVPLYRAVQGTTFFDQVKKLATAAMAMQATERNPDFGQDAKAVLGDEERLLIVACTVSPPSLLVLADPPPHSIR